MTPEIARLPWLPEPPADFRAQCRRLGPSTNGLGEEIRFLANHRLDASSGSSLGKAIQRCVSGGCDFGSLTPLKLGILGSGTFDFFANALQAAGARHGVLLELVLPPYDQVAQQALDAMSEINRQRPDAVLIAVDYRWLNLDRFAFDSTEGAVVAAAIDQLRTIIMSLRKHAGTPAIIQTIAVPPLSLFGSFDRRLRGTLRASIDEANRQVVALAEESGSYLFDIAALAERIGTDRWFDPVQWNLYKLPFAADFLDITADVLARILGAIRGKAKKCLVLDLDNTVWGGVIGDDGIDGIVIGQGHPSGEAFLAVQQFALDLHQRGILLAVSSKNDDHIARQPFRDRKDMLLREEHIAVFQANWLDKPSNLEAIAKQLNIGIDALVLLDDNPAERAQVRAAIPAVAVPELPSDPSWYPWYLSSAGYFEAIGFSAEDKIRAQTYRAETERAQVMAVVRDLGDYLVALDMVLTVTPFDQPGRQRITQLINKSNQFNLTTRRYTEIQIGAMESDPSIFALQARLRDRFGDLGMIAVTICRAPAHEIDSWEIDTWLMSCRVLGRTVEQAMLREIVAEARARGIARLVGVYRPTAKNGMVAEHYSKLGFSPLPEAMPGEHRFELVVAQYSPPDLPLSIERVRGDEQSTVAMSASKASTGQLLEAPAGLASSPHRSAPTLQADNRSLR